jgi:hypothetical protein
MKKTKTVILERSSRVVTFLIRTCILARSVVILILKTSAVVKGSSEGKMIATFVLTAVTIGILKRSFQLPG